MAVNAGDQFFVRIGSCEIIAYTCLDRRDCQRFRATVGDQNDGQGGTGAANFLKRVQPFMGFWATHAGYGKYGFLTLK